MEALVDETGAGKWPTAKSATITTQPPGTDGNIAAPSKRGLLSRSMRAMGFISKRAENVNEDYVRFFFFFFKKKKSAISTTYWTSLTQYLTALRC